MGSRSIARLRAWPAEPDETFSVESLYVGGDPWTGAVHAEQVKVTLKTGGRACGDAYGEYTINFNKNL